MTRADYEKDWNRRRSGLASTVDYYSEICRRSERWHRVLSTPEMSIESLDLSKAVSYLGIDGDEKSWMQFDGYHRAALQRLEASGAEAIGQIRRVLATGGSLPLPNDA